jgi:hypothetical protein
MNIAPHAATEMNFSLHATASRRLVRHGGYERWSTYLRNAVILNLHQPHKQNVIFMSRRATRGMPVYILDSTEKR